MNSGATEAPGIVVAGHGAASGERSDRYPHGTLALQIPIFAERGLDLAMAYPGTINVDTAPVAFVPGRADHTFADVAWTEAIPAETFSFHRCTLEVRGRRYSCWVYRPHPETKVEHLQAATVLECIGPPVPGIAQGVRVVVRLAPGRGTFA